MLKFAYNKGQAKRTPHPVALSPRLHTQTLPKLLLENGGIITMQNNVRSVEKTKEYIILSEQMSDRYFRPKTQAGENPETPYHDQSAKKEAKETIILTLVDDEPLGAGAFGWVFHAQESKTGSDLKHICIKQGKRSQLSDLGDEHKVYAWLQSSQSSHENVIKKLFFCEKYEIGLYILGLEYAQGKSLALHVKECTKSRSNFKEIHFMHVLRQQSDALCYLKGQKILHCDIKPDNIIYHKVSRKSRLIDFGLAKINPYFNVRQTSRPGGTMVYMAIEVFIDFMFHESSDIYCLGATMYSVAMKEMPWRFLLRKNDVTRGEMECAIVKEIGDYRRLVKENMLKGVRNHLATSLQSRLMRNHSQTGINKNLLHMVGRMISHDSAHRPALKDIDYYLQGLISLHDRSSQHHHNETPHRAYPRKPTSSVPRILGAQYPIAKPRRQGGPLPPGIKPPPVFRELAAIQILDAALPPSAGQPVQIKLQPTIQPLPCTALDPQPPKTTEGQALVKQLVHSVHYKPAIEVSNANERTPSAITAPAYQQADAAKKSIESPSVVTTPSPYQQITQPEQDNQLVPAPVRPNTLKDGPHQVHFLDGPLSKSTRDQQEAVLEPAHRVSQFVNSVAPVPPSAQAFEDCLFAQPIVIGPPSSKIPKHEEVPMSISDGNWPGGEKLFASLMSIPLDTPTSLDYPTAEMLTVSKEQREHADRGVGDDAFIESQEVQMDET